MRLSRIPLMLLMLELPVAVLGAQTHLCVDIRDPVYQILEAAELKGVLETQSSVRPYSRAMVVSLLDRLWESRGSLTEGEAAVLADARDRFGPGREGLRHGNIPYRPAAADDRAVVAGVDAQSRFRLNANNPEAWHLDSALRPYLRGDLGPWLSYLGILGFTLDRVSIEAFPPYSFTKEWDSIHISFGTPRYSEGDLAYPTISYDLETEIAAELLGTDVRVSLARQRREWGIGEGSLTLGGSARPFVGVETHFALAPWISGHYLLGSLSNWDLEPSGAGEDPRTLSFQKMLAIQRLDIQPFPWLSLSATSTILGAKRLELTYLSPLLFGVLSQNLIADLDNAGVGVDVAFMARPFGKAYVSFYADEMELTNLSQLFTRPRNMFALQGGLKLAVPWLPFTSLTLQYTRIEPFTYAHYPTRYPDYRIDVDTAYTHDGENLAYPLWPNSDEFLVKLGGVPLPRLRIGAEYRFIRHGDNPSMDPGDLAILGRPDGYLDYTVPLDDYPDKDFLHDGLYDYNHIVTLSGDYAIPNTPVTVGLSYTFSSTSWEPNDSGEPDRPDTFRNIVGIWVKVFR